MSISHVDCAYCDEPICDVSDDGKWNEQLDAYVCYPCHDAINKQGK